MFSCFATAALQNNSSVVVVGAAAEGLGSAADVAAASLQAAAHVLGSSPVVVAAVVARAVLEHRIREIARHKKFIVIVMPTDVNRKYSLVYLCGFQISKRYFP